MSTRQTKPFFYQAATQRWTKKLAAAKTLCIYAGAGVSIDRSGLSWERLAADLLATTLEPTTLDPGLVKAIGTQRLASIAMERLQAVHAESTPDRVAEALRPILYEKSSWVQGMLASQIAVLCVTRAAKGLRTVVVTSNYDDYIERQFQQDEVNVTVNGERSENWEDGRLIELNYLHGRIPERGAISTVVVSEADYAETQDRVTAELEAALSNDFTLILGSSLTDPPLIRSLLNTKPRAADPAALRLVLIPSQGNPATSSRLGRRLLSDGVAHLGCHALYPDFYCQVAQFLCEARVCAVDPVEYARSVSTTSYAGRLNGWWRSWMRAVQDDLSEQQRLHHLALTRSLAQVRDLIDAPEEERLKLELWMRWRPDDRKLRLWASSVGTWIDQGSMRFGDIDAESQYVSVRAFCSGYPILETASKDSGQRWRTYLATPVWVNDKKNKAASQIAGVVTLASMSGETTSSVSRRNRAKLRRALALSMDHAAQLLQAESAHLDPQTKLLSTSPAQDLDEAPPDDSTAPATTNPPA